MSWIRMIGLSGAAMVALQGGYCGSALQVPIFVPILRNFDVQGALYLSAAEAPTPPLAGLPLALAIGLSGTYFILISDVGVQKLTPDNRDLAFPGPLFENDSPNAFYAARARGITVDPNGNVYLAMSYTRTIEKLSPAGVPSLFAGVLNQSGHVDGPTATAQFDQLGPLACGRDGTLYVSDQGNGCVRAISKDGVVRTLAWPSIPGISGGPGERIPILAMAVDSHDRLLVAGQYGLWRFDSDGQCTLLAGQRTYDTANTPDGAMADGLGTAAHFFEIESFAIDASDTVYVLENPDVFLPGNGKAHTTAPDHVRRVTSAGRTSTLKIAKSCQTAVLDTLNKLAFDGRELVGLCSNPIRLVHVAPDGPPAACANPTP